MTTLGRMIRSACLMLAFSFAAAAVAGCDAHPLDESPTPAAGVEAGSGGAVGTGGGAGAGGGAPTITADAGSAAQATVPLPAGVVPAPYVNVTHEAGTCGTSLGSRVATTSAAEVASLLVGRWQLCGSSGDTPAQLGLPPHDGMELARDRSWRALVKNGDSLTPAPGQSSAGRWYMSAEDPHDMVVHEQSVVRISTNGGGATGYPVQIFQHPTMMLLGATLTYVWIGE
jgi:hypothetical protein